MANRKKQKPKEQYQTQAMEKLAKAVLDVDNAVPDDTKSAAKIKFQRTMRRLSVLRRFAKRLGLEFDIENMEISLLTKQRGSQHVDLEDSYFFTQMSELEQELLCKRMDFEEIIVRMQHQTFIPKEDIKNMEVQVRKSKKRMEKVTEMVEKLERFVFKDTDWKHELARNNRLGRRLLMAIKEHLHPERHQTTTSQD